MNKFNCYFLRKINKNTLYVGKGGGMWWKNPNFVLHNRQIYKMRFTGTIEAKLDAKGRVFLPSAFRKVLEIAQEETLYIRKDDFENCLTLYPSSVWNSRVDLLRAKMNPFSREDKNTFRQYVMNVEEVKLDGNGRFLISKKMLEMANLKQTVNFIGYDDVVEIWCPENQESVSQEPDEYSASLQNLMKD